MRDNRRQFIVNQETDHKANGGWATVCGAVFVFVMVLALLEHYLTMAWRAALQSLQWIGDLSPF
ncbi:hypothetical protein [Ensifer sp. YR511]|uniref:hypothetical protein n=1 Tax=Ensifer sp. YR511 TaxID=1855294 RepID=UPI00088A0AFB|nr:hypothetical protein [Ensifer sp. YR511]SDN95460.1 hypothetical protein SAMN05216328_14418 [Ensifer sp. YR511]